MIFLCDDLLCFVQQTSGGGKSSQDIIEELASDILQKIPHNFNLEEIQVTITKNLIKQLGL